MNLALIRELTDRQEGDGVTLALREAFGPEGSIERDRIVGGNVPVGPGDDSPDLNRRFGRLELMALGFDDKGSPE